MAHVIGAVAPLPGGPAAPSSLREANAARIGQAAPAPRPGNLPSLRGRPLAFLASYVRRHPAGHLTVLLSVIIAVTCSVSTQYGMKHLIDIVAGGRHAAGEDDEA